jgi:predicted enzyme related to lactoylglutathione lyase
MGRPVVHFEVIGRDAKRLQDFYGQLFEWKIKSDNPLDYGVVDTGSKLGIQGGIAQSHSDHSWVTFYVQVDDLQATLDRAAELGGETLLPPTDFPGTVSLAVLKDPEGHAIGLVKPQGQGG